MAVIRFLMTDAILWSICCNLILVEERAPFSSVFEDENEPSSPLFFHLGIFLLCVGLLAFLLRR